MFRYKKRLMVGSDLAVDFTSSPKSTVVAYINQIECSYRWLGFLKSASALSVEFRIGVRDLAYVSHGNFHQQIMSSQKHKWRTGDW